MLELTSVIPDRRRTQSRELSEVVQSVAMHAGSFTPPSMRRLVRVKGKLLDFDFPLVAVLLLLVLLLPGSFIAALLSALECARWGARCMLVSDTDERGAAI